MPGKFRELAETLVTQAMSESDGLKAASRLKSLGWNHEGSGEWHNPKAPDHMIKVNEPDEAGPNFLHVHHKDRLVSKHSSPESAHDACM